MISRVAAKKAALRWKAGTVNQVWPAEGIYARDDGPRYGTQEVRLGYTADSGVFIPVVDLRFADNAFPIYVNDRRGDKSWDWPSEMQRYKNMQTENL